MDYLSYKSCQRVVLLYLCQLIGVLMPMLGQAQEQRFQLEDRAKRHIEKIMNEYEGAKAEGERIARQAAQDIEAGREHPWLRQGNPRSEQDYIEDSDKATDDQQYLKQTWSCFMGNEGGLIGNSDRPGPTDLDAVCRASCPRWAFWCPSNKYEVIQYFWPEHQVGLNDWGINGLKPEEQSQKGQRFTRQALLQRKQESEQEIIRRLQRKNAVDLAGLQLPDRSEPNIGHSMNEGLFQASSLEQQGEAHTYRTRVAYRWANSRRPWSPYNGFRYNEYCMADAGPPRTSEKDIINFWTEFAMLAVVWQMPELTQELGERERKGYQFTTPPQDDVIQTALQNADWWKNQGPAAFRLARWQNEFSDLRQLGVQPNRQAGAEEFIYFGGGELMPLTGKAFGTLGQPPLAAAAYRGRRALYISGAKSFLKYHQDGEKGRANEYTVLNSDKSKDVDSMQMIFPKVSECFRSQRIPNLLQQTEDQWVKENFPHDLIGYVFGSGGGGGGARTARIGGDGKPQYGEIRFIHWNKRVACTCECFGIPSGCWTMDFPPDGLGQGRGSGDRPYGKFEPVQCRYMEGQYPSAFTGNMVQCIPNGKKYHGVDDNV